MNSLKWLQILAYGSCVLAQVVSAADRAPWTTSRFDGTPDPPLPLTTERVFPSLTFDQPVDLAALPGTDWMYVVELSGKVYAFDGSKSDPQRTLVFEGAQPGSNGSSTFGLVFHPMVNENRYVYLSWVVERQLVDDGTTVSRFELSTDSPPQILPETRTDIIQWPSGGHNGGCLKFGPDGYLYISAGDGSGPFPPDSEETGQDLGDLRATIFRIDVDRPRPDRPYSVPEDNPFVGTPAARPEIWAYGFRNPWKMSFSPSGEDLFVGDVGWELWELVYRVEKGGNYGWSVMEGRQPIRADIPRGPTPILPPLVDHHHVEARSVTGGYVYRGSELASLRGAYVYGDYVTGKVWALRNKGSEVTWQEEIADTPLAIITFGESRDGELLLVDYAGGIHRLVPNPQFGTLSNFPVRLSEAGLFADVAGEVPATGVIPYELAAEPWMDGAQAKRYVALPNDATIVASRNRENWVYPSGTVFAKTISVREGEAEQPRRLETQILHYDGREWHPYTYIWNTDQSDAVLAPAEGSSGTVSIDQNKWTWRYHSRSECNTCHTPRAGFVLGFFPQNIATPLPSGSDQLAEFVELAVFRDAFSQRDLAPEVVDPYDAALPLESRARTYLMLNCAHCHRRGGGGTAAIEFPLEHTLQQTNAINAAPTQGTFNIPHARIIAAGDPCRSVLYFRMATVGRGHMPHLGARRVDNVGLQLIHDWISRLPPAADQPEVPSFIVRNRASVSAAIERLNLGGPAGEVTQVDDRSIQSVFASTSAALQLSNQLSDPAVDQRRAEQVIAIGVDHPDPVIQGLFERFVPEQQRTARLGTIVNAEEILPLDGDPDRGRELFMESAGVQCRNCHQIGGVGKSVGPKLDDVGKRLTRTQILQSILEPSRVIDARWVAHTIVTTDGRVMTGLILERTDGQLLVRDSLGHDHQIPLADIEEQAAQQKSLMPELLVQDLTAGQLADLLEMLAQQK